MERSWWLDQALGVGAALAWLALVAGLATVVRQRWPQQREWSRKVAHIGAGPVVLIAWGMGLERWICVGAAAGVSVLALINHRRRLLAAIEDVGRDSFGTVAYAVSITLLLLLWWPAQRSAVAAGVLVMALGDGLAGLLGPLIPSPSWRVLGERRSLAGTAAMGMGSLAALVLVAALAPSPPPTAWGLALIALAATALEQIAWRGIDNVGVPLLVAALWRSLG
ncbi:MAG: dolichol kinase [Cyanobium sp.]